MKKYLSIMVSFCLVFLLSSCNTLPSPEQTSGGLLIIPIELIQEADYEWFGQYRITIKEQRTGKVVLTRFLPKSTQYTYIRDLPPGNYFISDLVFIYDEKIKKGSQIDLFKQFPIRENTITLLNMKFTYIIGDNEDGYSYMQMSYSQLTKDEKEQFFNKIKDYKNFDLWEYYCTP